MTLVAMQAQPVAEDTTDRLMRLYGHLEGADLLAPMITTEFPGRITVASSFGLESAVMLHLIAAIKPDLAITFLDTGQLFAETLQYRDTLQKHLGLTNVRNIGPETAGLDVANPQHTLWNTDACCHLRKVIPLEKALVGFDAWITGRKRVHGGGRAGLPPIELEDGRIKVNPLANWSQQKISAYYDEHNLPRHPLGEEGYTSVGCFPCTQKPMTDENSRSGRWAETEKTECGIHKAKWYRAGENI